jgi:hypothetical protein
MKELLEKLGVTVEDDADLETTATAIRTKIAEVLKHDPDFIEPIKVEATKKATEQAIVAEKKAKKAFKAIAGVDLTNSEIDSLSIEELFKTGVDKLKSATGSDAAKLQDEIIALGNALAQEKESKQTEIERILGEYKQKEVSQFANTELLRKIAGIELVVDTDTAIDFLTAKLAKDGIRFSIEDGRLTILKGDYAMLKADKTGKADIEYLVATYLNPFIKKSNGSGQANGQQRQVAGEYPLGHTKESWDRLPLAYRKDLEAKYAMRSA